MSIVGKVSEKLDALLEREYAALLDGDLASIERLGSEKVALLEKVSVAAVDDLDGFASMRNRLIRNQTLAQSAIEGMRMAIRRVKEINEVSASLRTYRKDGKKVQVAIRGGDALSKRS